MDCALKKQRKHCMEQRGAWFDAVHIPPCCSALSSEALVCFHDATCLAAGRVAEPCQLRVKDPA